MGSLIIFVKDCGFPIYNRQRRSVGFSFLLICSILYHLQLAPARKTPAENVQLWQIRENSKFNENFIFKSGSTIFVFDFNTFL